MRITEVQPPWTAVSEPAVEIWAVEHWNFTALFKNINQSLSKFKYFELEIWYAINTERELHELMMELKCLLKKYETGKAEFIHEHRIKHNFIEHKSWFWPIDTLLKYHVSWKLISVHLHAACFCFLNVLTL